MHDEVIAAMARQPMNLADPRVAQVIAACESGIKRLLKTDRAEVFFYSANGHGGWEAIIANLVGPGCLAGAAMSVQERPWSTLSRRSIARS